MVVSEFEYYGRVAFEAQRLYLNGMDSDGSAMPEWDDLSDEIQQSWVAAGKAAVNAYQGEK